EYLVDLRERADHSGAIEVVENFRGDGGEFAGGVVQFHLGVPHIAAISAEVLAVEGGKEPRLGLAGVAQLMALLGPQVIGLLHEVRRRIAAATEAERKAVKRGVMPVHEHLEIGNHCRWECETMPLFPASTNARMHKDASARGRLTDIQRARVSR